MQQPLPFIPMGTKHKTKIRQKLSLPDKTTIGMKITIALLSQDKGFLSFRKRLSEEINLAEMYDIWCVEQETHGYEETCDVIEESLYV